MNIKKLFWIILGFIGLGIGVVGAVVVAYCIFYIWCYFAVVEVFTDLNVWMDIRKVIEQINRNAVV